MEIKKHNRKYSTENKDLFSVTLKKQYKQTDRGQLKTLKTV